MSGKRRTKFTNLMVGNLQKSDNGNDNVIDNDNVTKNDNVIDTKNDTNNVIDDDYVIKKKVKFMDTHTRTLHYIPNELLVKLNRYCKQKGDKTEHMTRALTEYLKKLEKQRKEKLKGKGEES